MPFYTVYKWREEDMSLTEEEYVKKLGLHCPNCLETTGIDAWDKLEVDDGLAWQNVYCTICDAQWIDNYNLVGYSDLETSEGENNYTKEDTTNIQNPPNQQVAENWVKIVSERQIDNSKVDRGE